MTADGWHEKRQKTSFYQQTTDSSYLPSAMFSWKEFSYYTFKPQTLFNHKAGRNISGIFQAYALGNVWQPLPSYALL